MVKSISKKTGNLHTSKVTGAIISIAVSAAVLYYLYNLEQKHCKCIRDWRHTYIKYYAWVILLINLAELFNTGIAIRILGLCNANTVIVITGIILILLLALVVTNSYAIFTYIRDLNDTKCTCALTEMSTLNKVMLVLRWFYAAGAVILTLVYSLVIIQMTRAALS